MKLRKIVWNEKVWTAFKRAVAYIPLTVRMEAILTIIEASEKEARKRGSDIVEEQDLVRAAKKKVPRAYRSISLNILREQGINVDKYDCETIVTSDKRS
jgi:hypothetical protein